MWLQRKGAKSSVPLKAPSDSLVGFLLEEIDKKLKLGAPLDAITLQLIARDTEGKDQLVPLDIVNTIHEALIKASAQLGRAIAPTDTLHIVVDVAAPASLATVATMSGTFGPVPDADARNASVHLAAAAGACATDLMYARMFANGQPSSRGCLQRFCITTCVLLPLSFAHACSYARKA